MVAPRLLLLVVAALYGSLGICLRLLYSLSGPPTPAALSFVRQALTVAVFVPALGGDRAPRAASARELSGGPAWAAKPAAEGLWAAGLELAVWNLGTGCLLNLGLRFTGAARASFLTQLSVVITPLLLRFSGQAVPTGVRRGCVLALAGMVLMGSDGPPADLQGVVPPSSSVLTIVARGFSFGDLLCVGSAVTWSAYIFRLSALSRRNLPSVQLQAAKTALLCVLYLAWTLFDWIFVRRCPLLELWPGCTSPLAWGILIFSAVGPGALGDVWMQRASDSVSAATATVILATEPLFAAVLAGVVLGERLGTCGILGGCLIVGAALCASASDDEGAGDRGRK